LNEFETFNVLPEKETVSEIKKNAYSWSVDKSFVSPLLPSLEWWYAEDGGESWGSSITKLFVSILFLGFVVVITSITMTIVHEKVFIF
jgi:hypothetical protein